MSHQFYHLQWQSAMEELSLLIEVENPQLPVDIHGDPLPYPEEKITWDDAFQHYAILYTRYIQVMRKLEDCYDQIIHPQKRRDIKVVLETVMTRLCQVKAEMVRFGRDGAQLDFVNLEDILLDMKLSPGALQIPLPRYYTEHNEGDANEAPLDLLNNVLDEHGIDVDEHGERKVVMHLTREQAIQIIQKNERGRQGCMRAKLMRALRAEDILRKKLEISGPREQDPHLAATLIQKVFRGYLARRRTKRQCIDELVFIGLQDPPKVDATGRVKYDPVKKGDMIRHNRKARQAGMEVKYLEALTELEPMLLQTEGPEIREKMWQERYDWWLEQKRVNGVYPKSFAKFYVEQTAKAEAAKIAANAPTADELARMARAEAKAALAAKKKPAYGNPRKKKEEEEKAALRLLNTSLFGPSLLVNHLTECVHKYRNVWCTLDESGNHDQGYDENFAIEKLRPLVRDKIQPEVDAEMLGFLDNVKTQMTLRATLGKKKGKVGAKKKKSTKKKKAKTTKKGKKKKCCDGEAACSDLSLHHMVSILVKMNIIQRLRTSPKTLSNFVGSINMLGSTYQQNGVQLDPSLAQIVSCLTEYAVLPQGSEYVKAHAPLVNALLLYGPPGSGKTMLSRGIAAATGSTWIDLSSSTLEGKLGSKAECAKLVHMAFTVAAACQPSVIYIDDVDKIFVQKKKMKGLSHLAKMKQYLQQHKPLLNTKNRVLVIANSRTPFAEKVDQKDLVKFFGRKHNGKMIFCPCPNYDTRVALWTKFITATGLNVNELNRSPKFNLSTIAYISEGYSAGNILAAVGAALPVRRVQKLLENPSNFDGSDFITSLSKTQYTYKDTYLSYQTFTDEVNGEKERRRQKVLALIEEQEQLAEKKKQKGFGRK